MLAFVQKFNDAVGEYRGVGHPLDMTRELAEQMNLTSAAVASDVDEFSLAGLKPAASKVISVPRVNESPVALECRVCEVFQLEGADTALIDTWMVLAEVVAVHIE